MSYLSTFHEPLNIAIIGASGGIGGALVNHLTGDRRVAQIYAFSRSEAVFNSPKVQTGHIDLEDEETIAVAAAAASSDARLDITIIATGVLHDGADFQPEKSLRAIDAAAFAQAFTINAVGPALIAKHFLPRVQQDRKAVFAALSARVGSISDNRLGGWYAYRASKAALNMVLRTTAIEIRRRHKAAIVIGLHPGTVNTGLSKPFQANVPEAKLFTPEFASEQLLKVINERTPEDTGKLFAWDGQAISY